MTVIENPALLYDNGWYLFYSGNSWPTNYYATGIAWCGAKLGDGMCTPIPGPRKASSPTPVRRPTSRATCTSTACPATSAGPGAMAPFRSNDGQLWVTWNYFRDGSRERFSRTGRLVVTGSGADADFTGRRSLRPRGILAAWRTAAHQGVARHRVALHRVAPSPAGWSSPRSTASGARRHWGGPWSRTRCATVDPVGAQAAERETNWRQGYLTHFRRMVEAGLLRDGEAAVDVARAGLASLHSRMRATTAWTVRDRWVRCSRPAVARRWAPPRSAAPASGRRS